MLAIGVRVTADHHVVMQADATPLQPNSITHAVTLFMKKARQQGKAAWDAPLARTQMLAANIHPKIVSERLGHSKVGITLDLYSHVLPGKQEGAASQVDAMISAALQDRAEGQAVAKW